MDLQERHTIDIEGFFEEKESPLQIIAPQSDIEESLIDQEHFAFNIEQSLNLNENQRKLPLPLGPNFQDCELLRQNQDIDDTNLLDVVLTQEIQQDSPQDHISNILDDISPSLDVEFKAQGSENQPSETQLEQIINFLVEYSSMPIATLRTNFERRFRQYSGCWVVECLIEKFGKIKKTKQELIKYCIRKAFKFILQLPKNRHMLTNQKCQKFSFSKCKNRYLKKVSDEKSMNSKFLHQLFNDGDFSQDYKIFLQNFEQIMLEDNQKKVKYLAWLLTNQKEGKKRSIEVVKRLPWTSFILDKVRKISVQMLKFSDKE